MATVQNRSRYRVTVRNRPDLEREVPYNRLTDVKKYVAELRSQGLKPNTTQLEDNFEVRVRQRGYREFHATAKSLAEASQLIKKVEEERSRGLFLDYTRLHRTSMAEIMVRFLREESPRRKSAELERYKIEGWLGDSGALGKKLLASHRQQQSSTGKPARSSGPQMRDSSEQLEWIHKPFGAITAVDIESYIRERLEVVKPSTVDRELEIFSSIFNVAIKTWGFHVAVNPMAGVRRPKYFNERDRRLKGDEEERLLDAASALDTERAVEARLRELVHEQTRNRMFSSDSARKKICAELATNLLQLAQQTAVPATYFECFIQFQSMTGARRGETLSSTWANIDWHAQTAYLPETKNGRPRKLPLRRELLDLLRQLPRDGKLVFPMGVDALTNRWRRICTDAGISDLTIHDLRHEAISRVAEVGSQSFASFGFVELQAFSGHRDVRMLLRYAHLCASRMADRLDAAFAAAPAHKGRHRLAKGSGVQLAELMGGCPEAESAFGLVSVSEPSSRNATRLFSAESPEAAEQPNESRPDAKGKVIQFPYGRRIAR